MQVEFERLAGRRVSPEMYKDIIEPMYMATDISKEDFVKLINIEAVALPDPKKLVAKMRKICKHMKETCNSYFDLDEQVELLETIDKYIEVVYGGDVKYALKMEFAWECERGCRYPRKVEFWRPSCGWILEEIELA